MFKLMDKKIITIFRKSFLLNWPYENATTCVINSNNDVHFTHFQHSFQVSLFYTDMKPVNHHLKYVCETVCCVSHPELKRNYLFICPDN